MKAKIEKQSRRARRKIRVRKRVSGTRERPRVTVTRSLNHLSCQFIDDDAGVTLLGLSTLSKAFKESGAAGGKGGNRTASEHLGALVAKRATELGIKKVVFDRNGYRYHGRVRALADALRKNGLEL